MTKRQHIAIAAIIGLILCVVAIEAYAGTGGVSVRPVWNWFRLRVQGWAGRLIAVIALFGAIALTGVSMRVGGVGALLFVVLGAAFGVAFINAMITAVV